METTLCFDFGNSRLKCAILKGEEVEDVIWLEDDRIETVETVIDRYKPDTTILSSVILHNSVLEEYLSSVSRFVLITAKSNLPFTTPVTKPETIGPDRLGMVAAAVDLFPEQHNLVIGLGSCITYNFVNKFHQFLGGGISPGMQMRFKAMHELTAKLPLVKGDENFPLVGYDTATNILSGVIWGMRKEIDGMIDLYKEKYANFNVLLTGGDMGYFVPHLKNKIFANPYLIYKGMYAISKKN